ncbi:MAG: AAA family ATPase [Sphingomonadales bacterium]
MTQTPQIDLERKLITVASGKGGVGKTVFAITLSHILARMGRKVLLFDGDIGLANVDIQLGIMPEHDVGDVINGSISLSSAIFPFDDPVNKDGRLDIVAGKSGSGALNTLSKERLIGLRAGLTALAGRYDHVILDLAAGIEMSVQTLSGHGGAILVILTADPTSLTDAYAFIKLTLMRDPEADIRVVVNLADTKRDGERTYKAIKRACEGFLQFTPPLAGIIHTDERVVESIRRQTAIVSRYPQAQVVADIKEIARQFPTRAKALAG